MDYGTTFKLDDSGDIVINELNTISMISGIEKVKQDIIVLLKTIKGEHPDNPNFGVDWIKIRQGNEKMIKNEIIKALSNYPFLKSIDDIQIKKNRDLSIIVKATLKSGEQIEVNI